MIGKLPQPSSTHIAPAWSLEMQFVGKEGLEDLGFEYVGTPQMVVIFQTSQIYKMNYAKSSPVVLCGRGGL